MLVAGWYVVKVHEDEEYDLIDTVEVDGRLTSLTWPLDGCHVR